MSASRGTYHQNVSVNRSVFIEVYNSYLTRTHLCVRARILFAHAIRPTEKDSWLINLKNSFKRLNTVEIPCAKIIFNFQKIQIELRADSEGYIEIFKEREVSNEQPAPLHDLAFSLTLPDQSTSKGPITTITIKRPFTYLSDHFSYGLISDIDDTIMMTGVSSWLKWRVIYNSFFINPFKRQSFGKTAAYYRQFVKSPHGDRPLFYVSNSPWNFYHYLRSFIRHNHFPEGILMLRDLKIDLSTKRAISDQTKYKEVKQVITALPLLPFYLIGDAGELDAYIYLAVAEEMPDRIRGVFIREVEDDNKNKNINFLFDKYANPRFLLFKHIEELAVLIPND
jgi:phosphatidate phosphatase APP1